MNAELKPTQVSTVQALNLALDAALRSDPRVFLLGEDLGDEEGAA